MKKSKWCLSLSLVVLIISSFTFAFAADIPETLRFGLLPAEDPGTMTKAFQGIADYVGGKVGLPVKVWVSQSYNALIEAMNAGQLDIAYFGPAQYVAAKEQGMNIVPLVVAVDDTGRAYYKASIITLADSGINKLNDLKGKTFAFVAPTSTGGGVGPYYYLLKHNINPEKDFKRFYYAGKHDSVFMAVMNKKVDAGAVADVYFPRWKERGILKYKEYIEEKDELTDGDIRIVGAQRVPGLPMVARGDLGKEFIEKLKVAFQSIPKETLAQYKVWGALLGFKGTSPKDFEELVEMRKVEKEMQKK
jgi:phosphonate transport system substrate-binding protein